jgi:PIN domain nuclease of toxin-antitoxin system
MTEAVIDSSVLIAFVRGEAGAEIAAAALPDSLLSAVNLAEVISTLTYKGADALGVEEVLNKTPCRVIDFDQHQAILAGKLRPLTAHLGLSLGDRACLALAMSRNLPVLTADRAWSALELGVDVRLIR